MSDYNENNQGGYDSQSSSQSFGQGTGGAPIPPNSYYHYQGAGPGGVAGTNATAPVNPASPYAQSAGAHNAQAYAAKQDPKPKKSHSGAKTFGIAFAGAALACVLVLGGTGVVNTVTSGSPSGSTTVLGGTSSASTSGNADENATLAESVSQKCLPSVVAIDVYTNQQSGYYGYSTQNSLTETSLGSGVVLSSDGYIVTNYHVIEGADALKVTIEGEEYDADIIGSDPSSDIAVIKAKNASGLTAMELGDSDALTVGEWVMSIGSPFGLEQSVATGIVSATNRSQIMDNSSNSNQYGQQQSSRKQRSRKQQKKQPQLQQHRKVEVLQVIVIPATFLLMKVAVHQKAVRLQVNQAVMRGQVLPIHQEMTHVWMMDCYTRTVRMQKVFLNN